MFHSYIVYYQLISPLPSTLLGFLDGTFQRWHLSTHRQQHGSLLTEDAVESACPSHTLTPLVLLVIATIEGVDLNSNRAVKALQLREPGDIFLSALNRNINFNLMILVKNQGVGH